MPLRVPSENRAIDFVGEFRPYSEISTSRSIAIFRPVGRILEAAHPRNLQATDAEITVKAAR
jgi:hypothetical protein